MVMQEQVHPELGLVCSPARAESAPESRSEVTGCASGVNMLSEIFGRVAEVSVLEVRCRSRGDTDCTFAFAFGSSEASQRLEALLGEDEDFGTAALRPGPANRPAA